MLSTDLSDVLYEYRNRNLVFGHGSEIHEVRGQMSEVSKFKILGNFKSNLNREGAVDAKKIIIIIPVTTPLLR